VQAAAQQWGVDASTLRTETRNVIDASGRKVSYGKLSEAAARLPPPAKVTLKDPRAFTIIGKPIKRLDTLAKVTGNAEFGLDVKLPGMLTAVVARGPIFGAKAVRFDDAKARSMPGVRKIVQIPSGVPSIPGTKRNFS